MLFVCQRMVAHHVKVDIIFPMSAATLLERTEAALRAAGGRILAGYCQLDYDELA